MSKKSVAENKLGAYVGWGIILGLMLWGGWVAKKSYDEYSDGYALGAASATRFWNVHGGIRGPALSEAVRDFLKSNSPHRPETRWTWNFQGVKVHILEMRTFRDWCYEQGWDSGFHGFLDQKPK